MPPTVARRSIFALSSLALALWGGALRLDGPRLEAGAPPGALMDIVDYSDTFTVAEYGGVPERADGSYNTGRPAYDVENSYGNPAATWTPQTNFSFNSIASSYGAGPVILPGATGNPGAESGMAQSGGDDFSFAYGLRSNYVVQTDAFLSPFDRTDISSVPFPGAGIFSAPSLSVFFRRDSSGAIGLFNGSFETTVTDAFGEPLRTGIDDDNWHNLAVNFDQAGGRLRIWVDRVLKADLDLATFAGGAYANYSNAAVGAGGYGCDWGGGRVLWFDNFLVGGFAGLNPCFTATPLEGVVPFRVTFDASCSNLEGAGPEAFQWDFGDGSSGEGPVVQHDYLASGRYAATLTLASGGSTASTSKTITVYGRVLAFEDDFSRPDGPVTGWTVATGSTWALSGGSLVMGPSGPEHFIWAGDLPVVGPANAVFDFDLAFLAAGTYPAVGRHGGFQFHCTRPTQRYGASAFSGYFIDWIDRAEDRGVRLTRDDNGTLVLLVAGQGAAAPKDPPSRYRVVTLGERIQVFTDDADSPVIDIVDGTYRGGFFGFWTWEYGQQVAIDNFRLNGTPLTACFTVSGPTFPLTGDALTFDGSCSSVFDFASTITGYSWDFGDETRGTGAVASHAYALPGTYRVELTVQDDVGATASFAKTVRVSENLAPFADCFEGPPGDPAAWTIASGSWTVVPQGYLKIATGGEAFLYAGKPASYLPPDFTAEVECRFVSGTTGGVGRHGAVHFFWNKETTNRFAADSRGYSVFWIDRASDRGWSLLRFANGGYTVLNPPGGTPTTPEPPARLRIEVTGPRILVLADGVPVIDVQDSVYRDGLFGLWSYANSEIWWDSVRVWSGEEPAPCPGTAEIAGDCNLDGRLDVSDISCYVQNLYRGFLLLDRRVPAPPPCPGAWLGDGANARVYDLNGDGRVDVSDVVRLAYYLFLGGAPPVQGAGCFATISDFEGCVPNAGCP